MQLNVGTFFGVIAVALAASIPADNQTQSLIMGDFGVPNSTGPSPNKGLPEWIATFFPGFSGWGSSPIPTTPPENVGPVQYPKDCPKCKCGLTNKRNRIVGGTPTEENQYPWMAMLLNQGRFYCGGAFINSLYVLTAAHCVEGFKKQNLKVRALAHDVHGNYDSKTQDFEVSDIIRHSGYSTYNYNNDIALLKLKKNVKFDDKMRPVCLPEAGKTFSGEKAIVTGWGAIGESGALANELREVTVPILSNKDCKDSKYPARRITENMICAGYTEGGKDSCQGDSGGPLHVINDTIHHIVGVVSWGEGCAQPNYPGVYARVNRFLTWIKSNTKDACYC